jgi:DNA-binding response OmpR family regulator
MKIFVVEDDPDIVEGIKLSLELYNPAVEFGSSASGKEALEMLRSNQYCAAMVDLGLPDIDGIEVIKQLRTFSQIPALIITARNDRESIRQAIDAGANGYMLKPFTYWDLLNHLNKYIKIQSQSDPGSSSATDA